MILPETLGQEDIHPTVLGLLDLDPETPLVPLNGGFHSGDASRVYRLGPEGSRVIKVGTAMGPVASMEYLRETMDMECNRMAQYVGDHMPNTEFLVSPSREKGYRSRVVTMQDFVPGPVLPDHLAEPAADNDEIIRFFKQCVMMYRLTNTIPDLADGRHRFNPLRSTNVVVTSNENGPAMPMLTDTGFAKMQHSRLLGQRWSHNIYIGVQQAIRDLMA